jgi:altronate hydrolase
MNDTPQLTIRLHPDDNVIVARSDILAGTNIPGEGFDTAENIPAGHKVAAGKMAKDTPIRKYNQTIAFASQDISPGQHVHTQNAEYQDFERDYAIGADVKKVDMIPVEDRATFMGYRRANGQIATRNYIGIVTTVNCSATAARQIARYFEGDALADYPNVDGVVAIVHGTGCGGMSGDGAEYIVRAIGGYADHANFAGVMVLGLGCEALQVPTLMKYCGLEEGDKLSVATIQDLGGSNKTVQEGIARVKAMLPAANKVKREPIPASELTLALECGGSDGYSGISANPSLGAAADLLVRHGGTACLAETPEIYGAEHLLTRRAVSQEVAEKLIGKIKWWENYAATRGAELNNNPSPGNKAGGLTTILEKSLGAAAKGGTTNLQDVYSYGERISKKGFVFMDTPGYDPASITGMVAGGANVVCFTTGRGSVYGCKPAPSIKLATNSAMYNRMADDMDINCGQVVDGDLTVQEMGEQIFQTILATASGEQTKSERWGLGDDEFVPWITGAVL